MFYVIVIYIMFIVMLPVLYIKIEINLTINKMYAYKYVSINLSIL